MQFIPGRELGGKSHWKESQAHCSKRGENCPKRRFGCAIPSAQMTAFGCRRRIEAHSALMILYRSRPGLIPRAYSGGQSAEADAAAGA